LQTFVDAEKISWTDSWLESLDLEYHQLNPARSLVNGIAHIHAEDLGVEGFTAREFHTKPPTNTRAALRSEAMRLILQKKLPYVIDWDLIYIGESKQIHLDDPYACGQTTLKDLRGPLS
jgi:proteasome accessory factor A